MKHWMTKSIGLFGLCAFLLVGSPLRAQTAPTKDTKAAKTTTEKASKAATALTDQEIADAKAKGLVWVNLSSKIYHKEGKFYGKTKSGKFMTEDDAKKAGYREAKTETSTKAKSKTSETKQK
ncbi:MAG TPA: hypothetical protein VEI95_08830 [Acidobacteriota bacterium]|nr:hypothetical protein [Acidobacteriota bacterium]